MVRGNSRVVSNISMRNSRNDDVEQRKRREQTEMASYEEEQQLGVGHKSIQSLFPKDEGPL
jgi:hypothetical protein